MAGGSLAMPFLLFGALCVEEDDTAKADIISTIYCFLFAISLILIQTQGLGCLITAAKYHNPLYLRLSPMWLWLALLGPSDLLKQLSQ